MRSKFATLASVVALVLSMSVFAFGQETTGSIEITTRDQQGNVVPGVTVTIRSRARTGGDSSTTITSTGFSRTVTTDQSGFSRVQQVPPGFYSVTAGSISGFGELTLNNVEVVLGRATPVSFDLRAGGVAEEVTVTAGDAIAIDTTDSKIQTNLTARTAELLPKGINFTSLLNVAPAVRNEPLSGGFQIDGASGSENTFIIDGQEVTNFRTGVLNANNNVPFQFVQEVQVKSSGFEAEFGGATGGVINVVTRGGNNQWRGEFGTEFRPGSLQGHPRAFQRLTTVAASGATTALTQVEYISPRRDAGTDVFPFASLSGPIVRDRAWFFGSYAPSIFRTYRSLEYLSNDPRTRTVRFAERYTSRQRNDYAFGRIDLQPFNNLRMTGTYLWNPIDLRGTLPANTTVFDNLPALTFPGVGVRSGAQYLDNVGGRQSSNNTTGSIVWTPNERLVLTARGGYSFLNEKLGNYGVPGVQGQTRHLVQAGFGQAPAGFGLAAGTQNFAGFQPTVLDASRRRTFDADASYLVSNFIGRHQFKGGVQFNGISNQIDSTLVDTMVYRFGVPISELTGRTDVPTSPNAIGSGWLQRFAAAGSASSDNLAFYIQDSWQPVSRLTLNLGVRTEREQSPSFNELGPGIRFDFSDKIAPRLGFALDLFGDGRTKVFGSYGQFYDRFKYELPRGSFGGNFFRNDYFEIFPGQTIANFTRQTVIGSNPDPIGGRCPIPNPTSLSRCQFDFRIPSNLPEADIELGAVDPDLKAFRQSEYTIGVERAISRDFLLRARYTHKQVDVAVEDIGVHVPGGEAYIIGNPGRGLAADVYRRFDFTPLEAVRDYDALEIGLDKRFVNNFYFNTSYTYSRLFGNYAGLASSDEPTGGTGRTSPNVNRNFDLPFIGFSALGQPDNGRLATDRPHVFKLSGAYEMRWSGTNSSEISGFTTLQSGTPVTTRFTYAGVAGQILNGRGDLGRTEAFSQTDFGLRHRYRFGGEGRFVLVANLDILNLFDEANELGRFEAISSRNITLAPINTTTRAGDLGLTTDVLQRDRIMQRQNISGPINTFFRTPPADACPGGTAGCNFIDPRYNQPNLFQAPRQVRFGFRLQF